jgi:hypothetical protein
MVEQREWRDQRGYHAFLSKALPVDAYHSAIDVGSAGNAQAGALRKARGVRAGLPDYLIVYRNVTLWIEFKHRAQLSLAQQLTRDALMANGHFWYLARCPEDVEQACRDVGIPLRATFGQIHQRIAEQNARLPVRKKRAPRARASGAITVAQAHRMGIWRP